MPEVMNGVYLNLVVLYKWIDSDKCNIQIGWEPADKNHAKLASPSDDLSYNFHNGTIKLLINGQEIPPTEKTTEELNQELDPGKLERKTLYSCRMLNADNTSVLTSGYIRGYGNTLSGLSNIKTINIEFLYYLDSIYIPLNISDQDDFNSKILALNESLGDNYNLFKLNRVNNPALTMGNPIPKTSTYEDGGEYYYSAAPLAENITSENFNDQKELLCYWDSSTSKYVIAKDEEYDSNKIYHYRTRVISKIDITGNKAVRIQKPSKYEHNVVFNEAGLNELISNIKAWPYAQDKNSLIAGGISISNGSDLNDYTIPGRYSFKKDPYETYQIQNGPTSTLAGFTLHVIGDYDEPYVIQILTCLNGIFYRQRGFTVAGNQISYLWESWKNISQPSSFSTGQVGSSTTPIYLNNNGSPQACSQYAGGTHIWQNGVDKTATDAYIYAPDDGGTEGQFLKSNGNAPPTWADVDAFPSDGAAGQFLQKTPSGVTWADVDAFPSGGTAGQVLKKTSTGVGWGDVSTTDTKNTAGATNTSSKIYLIGAASQDANPQTYSRSTCYLSAAGYLYADRVYNAVFNDYAEYRTTINLTPGHVVVDNDNGSLICSSVRLQPGAQVISDTFGHSMGETDTAKTPLAVAGRVLVYTYQPRENYHAGMAVCSAPDGTVDIMTREEIRDYPDCIVGIVSEIPQYETWGSDNVKVDGLSLIHI